MATKNTKTETQTETKAAAASAPQVVRKLTVKGVYGDVRVKDIPEGDELKICRMAGIAKAVDRGQSNYGDWEALVGDCAATNYTTGEIFVGSSCFVPGAMGPALCNALENAQREDATAVLKFAVDVSVKVSPRDGNKYEYIVRPVIESDVRNQAMLLLSI